MDTGELKQKLTPEQYNVCINCGTEPAFDNEYWDEHREGTYYCRVCDVPLFESGAKFDSGTGWPSFVQPVSGEVIKEKEDDTFGMHRTEAVCANCGSHLGHIFPDLAQTWPVRAGGPAPTHLRYCINSASLRFEPKDE